MIPFEEIPARLKLLGKNRAWLAEAAERKLSSVSESLNPNAGPTKRSPKLQRALTDAIEREEANQVRLAAIASMPTPQSIPDRISIECKPEERELWAEAANAQDLPLDAWMVDSLNTAAEIAMQKLSLVADKPGENTQALGSAGNGQYPARPKRRSRRQA